MKGRQIPYSAEEREFIRSVSQWPRHEAHAAFCQKFSRDDVSLKNFNALCKRNGWLTGRTGCFAKGQTPHNKGVPCEPGRGGRHPNARRTQFKKGNQPHNTNYLHHERVSKDGYVEISIDEQNPHTGFERRYVLKHKWLWEQANGPVPKGYALKCLGDRLNTDPSNWELVPRALLPRLAGGNRYNPKLAFDDAAPELRPAILAVAKLEHQARAIRKGRPA
ncbi:HNH endonuclease [Sphingobium sp. PNB]|uniref:HNH endonuclease n=1 Tax=Sphingobium sp. PNB TaxID=863934 RepID=UPI001CA46C07|nr:HNH endonuclease [Sphingobium sp. PNB]MCB4863316.1 HNH endonuclease [Sphingobium sp. PNB]